VVNVRVFEILELPESATPPVELISRFGMLKPFIFICCADVPLITILPVPKISALLVRSPCTLIEALSPMVIVPPLITSCALIIVVMKQAEKSRKYFLIAYSLPGIKVDIKK
jgi:hypothetical protein